jgi:uncharacterized protein YndB with AHSA1/START domain
MTNEALRATTTINTSAEVVFAVLTDPSTHPDIDGTGWVHEPIDGERLTKPGQVFRMAMYHPNPNHPSGHYQVANRVEELDPPRVISWKPGEDVAGVGTLRFGGWIWRYDLTPIGPGRTEVTLSYDWSAVPEPVRERIQFPPFQLDHLDNSLRHLAELAGSR